VSLINCAGAVKTTSATTTNSTKLICRILNVKCCDLLVGFFLLLFQILNKKLKQKTKNNFKTQTFGKNLILLVNCFFLSFVSPLLSFLKLMIIDIFLLHIYNKKYMNNPRPCYFISPIGIKLKEVFSLKITVNIFNPKK
jgi:hypothetical protein